MSFQEKFISLWYIFIQCGFPNFSPKPSYLLKAFQFFATAVNFSAVIFGICITTNFMVIDSTFRNSLSHARLISLNLSSFIITLYYHKNRKHVKNLIVRMDELEKGFQKFGLNIKRNSYKSYNFQFQFIHKFLILLASALYAGPVMLANDPKMETFVYPVYFPFDINSVYLYQFLLFAQMMTLYMPACQRFANDIFFIALVKRQSDYFETLQIALKEKLSISSEDINNKTKQKEINNYLKQWTQLHSYSIGYLLVKFSKKLIFALRNFQEINKFFGPIIIMIYLNLSVMVISLLFNTFKIEIDPSRKYGSFSYTVITVFQLAVQSEYAELIKQAKSDVAEEIYSVNWYFMDAENKKMLKFMHQIGSKDQVVTAYGAPTFTICRDALLQFLKSVISVYIAVSQIDDAFDKTS